MRTAFGIAAAMVAWLAAANGPARADDIKIGEINSYPGLPAFTEPYRKGWQLALDEINAKGGADGKQLVVISKDDGGKPAEAVTAANQLVELRNGSPTGALAFASVYDANGNLIQKCEGTGVSRTTTTCSGSTVSSFTWNPDDQLIAFYKPGVSESYQYDQAGRRIAKTSNGVTTYYRYNGDDIDAEYSATWSETARYVHGPNTDDPLMRLTEIGRAHV